MKPSIFPLPVSHEETQALCSVGISLTETVVSLTREVLAATVRCTCIWYSWQSRNLGSAPVYHWPAMLTWANLHTREMSLDAIIAMVLILGVSILASTTSLSLISISHGWTLRHWQQKSWTISFCSRSKYKSKHIKYNFYFFVMSQWGLSSLIWMILDFRCTKTSVTRICTRMPYVFLTGNVVYRHLQLFQYC